MKLVITETPSAAAAIAVALGVKVKKPDISRAAISFRGALGIWRNLWGLSPARNNTRNDTMSVYPFLPIIGSTPYQR